jgi:hypothetical protein
MADTCETQKGEEIFVQRFDVDLELNNYLENLSVDGIILKFIIKKYDGEV